MKSLVHGSRGSSVPRELARIFREVGESADLGVPDTV